MCGGQFADRRTACCWRSAVPAIIAIPGGDAGLAVAVLRAGLSRTGLLRRRGRRRLQRPPPRSGCAAWRHFRPHPGRANKSKSAADQSGQAQRRRIVTDISILPAAECRRGGNGSLIPRSRPDAPMRAPADSAGFRLSGAGRKTPWRDPKRASRHRRCNAPSCRRRTRGSRWDRHRPCSRHARL